VRRRKSPLSEDDDLWLVDEIEKRGLMERSNIFFFQRYGMAKTRDELDKPFIIKNPIDFSLIAPDGTDWETDLEGRSEWMGGLL